MELNITLRTEESIQNIILSGKLNYNTSPEFDKIIAEQTDGMSEIRVDMSELIYISSIGIRSMMQSKKALEAKGIRFIIVSPTETVMEVFTMTGLQEIFDIVFPENDKKIFPEIYPLRPIQRLMIDTQLMKANSTMMNVGLFMKFVAPVDMQVFAKALNSLIKDHDIFRCRFIIDKNTGDICQRFDGEIKPVIVEMMTDDEFEQNKGKLRKPYEIINHQLWNIRLISTPSENYFLLDFFHAITDGVAIVLVFRRDLGKRYSAFLKEAKEGKINKHIYRSSSYGAYIAEEMQISDDMAEEGHNYWAAMIDGFDEKKHLPTMDINEKANFIDNEIETAIDIIKKDFFSGKSYNENTFFLAATILTMAKLTHRPDVIISWVHNGRTTKTEWGLMGIMLDQFPIRWDFEQGLTSTEFLVGLDDKINESLKYRKSLDYVYNTGVIDDIACFILQKGAIGRRGKIKFGDTWAEITDLQDEVEKGAESTIDIELNSHDDGTYSLVLNYNTGCYSRDAMMNFTKVYSEMISVLQGDDNDLYKLLGL